MNYTNECLYKDIYVIIEMMEDELKNRINPQFIEFLKIIFVKKKKEMIY